MSILIISMSANTQRSDQYVGFQAYKGTKVKKEVKLALFVLALLSFIILALLLGKSDDHSTSEPSQFSRMLEFDHDYRVIRGEYRDMRKKYLKDKDSFPSLKLIESNLDINKEPDSVLASLQSQSFSQLDSLYHFEQIKTQLPFCLIVQSLNFTQPFMFQFTLNSIFSQNYSNYKAVIFSSDPKYHKSIEDYSKIHNISIEHYVLITDKEDKGIIQNIRTASKEHCQKGSISLNIAGNHQLIGKNVLKVFNSVYQTNKVGMVYSNFYTYDQGFSFRLGFNAEYSKEEMYNIRKQHFGLSTSVTYFTEHFLKIDPKDLKDYKGNDLNLAYEQAVFFALTQITCRKVLMIDGLHVLVKSGVKSYEEFKDSLRIREGPSRIAREKRPSECDQSFENELKHKTLVYHLHYFTEEPALKWISVKRKQKGGAIKDAKSAKIFQIPEGGSHKLAKYLYKDGNVIKERERYQKERIEYINMLDHQDNKKLIKANLKLGEYSDPLQPKQEEEQLQSAKSKHKLNQNSEQLSFCIVVEELHFNQIFRFQHVLNSIFNQHYQNFFAVIVNSNIKMDQAIRRYLHFYKISKPHFVYLQNYEDRDRSEMLYNAVINHCSRDSVTIAIDGAGELLGKNTLKVFNRYFLQYKNGFVYSNHYLYKESKVELNKSKTEEYNQEEKSKNKIRSNKKYGQLMAFSSDLFHQIDSKDFHDDSGKFVYGNFDNHIYSSLLELSCKNIHKIQGFHYVQLVDVVDEKRSGDRGRYMDVKKTYSCKKNKKEEGKPTK